DARADRVADAEHYPHDAGRVAQHHEWLTTRSEQQRSQREDYGTSETIHMSCSLICPSASGGLRRANASRLPSGDTAGVRPRDVFATLLLVPSATEIRPI